MGEFWAPTSQMFSSLFEKPKMSQKLLEKPPFKYIFDIFLETCKTTGYAKGLFTQEEQDQAFYDTKERKLAYLKKISDLTQIMLNESVIAKPGKIVAGLEPENTNLLLQQIYKAAVSGKSSDPFVKKVLAANGADIPLQQQAAAPQAKAKEAPVAAPQIQQQQPAAKAPEQPKPKPKEQQAAPQERAPVPPVQPVQQQEKVQPPPIQQEAPKKKKPEEPAPKPQQQPVPNQQQQQDVNARPSTAKRRPPKLASNQVEEHGAKKQSGPSNLIKDNNDDNFDEVVQGESEAPLPQQNPASINAQQHGKFIRGAAQQAEKAISEIEGKEQENQNEGESKIKLGRLGGKKKTTDGVKNQVAQNLGTSQVSDTVVLQTLVQQICQSANPLGKSLEFIQDDLESMNHELSNWRKIYEQSRVKMGEMSKTTEDSQQPLFDKIAEVEESMREKKSKIQNLKAQIIKNKFTIESLLKSVVIQK